MSPSAFLDRGAPPGERELMQTLGRAAPLWAALHAALAERFAPLTEKWGFSGASHGWLLRLMQRQRTLLYLIPGRGSFVASFALDAATCRAVSASALPAALREAVERAPRFAEGRGVKLEVRTRTQVRRALELAALKMAG